MKRLLKFAVIFVLAAQWYGRGGREFLFGIDPTEEIPGVLDTFALWIDLPPGVVLDESDEVNLPVRDPQGEEVGRVVAVRWKQDARNAAGHQIRQMEARGLFERSALGYPINVAVSQARDYTRRSLGAG